MAQNGRRTQVSHQRIIGANASHYVGKNVCVIGECISLNTAARTLTILLPDEEQFIILLNNNVTLVEPNRLTEVSGKLVSRAQVEAYSVKQFDPKQTALFNKELYVQMSHVVHAQKSYYEV